MSEKQMKVLGWVATFMSVMMYVSYFPQIMNNLAGQKGNFIQPLVAAINCSLWVYYGLFKKEIFPLLLPMLQVSFWPCDGYYSFDLKRRLVSVLFVYENRCFIKVIFEWELREKVQWQLALREYFMFVSIKEKSIWLLFL